MTVSELKEHMKQAMRDKDSVALTTIRNVLASVTNELVNLGRGPGGELSEPELESLMRREVKRLKDSISQFTDGGRDDLASDSQAELAVIEKFLPALMSLDELRPLVKSKLEEMNITSRADAGRAVGMIMKDLTGRADGADVKIVVEEILL